MDQSTVLQPGTVALEPSSTVLNPQTVESVSGGGRPDLREADSEGSIQSVLEAELKSLREADEKAKKGGAEDEAKPDDGAKKAAGKDAEAKSDDKAEKVEKARNQDGKFAKAEAADKPDAEVEKNAPQKGVPGQEGSERRPSEGRHPEPPARFLPEARAKWANVPNEVKAEVHRVAAELEQETQQYRASHERYSQIREFDELARSNGRNLRESLTRVVQIEDLFARDPIAGLETVLQEVGPRTSDGRPLTLYQVAEYILRAGPEAYQARSQAPAPAPQHAQRQMPSPDIQALTSKVQSLEVQLASQALIPVVARFGEQYPDFEDLSPRITQILESEVIDKIYGSGLSLEQKLSEAYRMAGGHVSSSRSDAEAAPGHSGAQASRPVHPDAGKKSVRGAPDDGADTRAEEPDTDIRDVLRKEMRKMRV